MHLDDKDRLFLINQYLILEKLYPEESYYYRNKRKAIEGQFELHYDMLDESSKDRMTSDECKEVMDILDMFRAISFSLQKMPEEHKEKLDFHYLVFRGFDGNNEGRHFSYALYLVNDLGRWEELKEGKDYKDLNSHAPVLEMYRSMLGAWQKYPVERRFNLSRDDLLEITSAARGGR